MDYKAIYDRFIQSRRENPPKESEYFERHHIVPRCMGGGDNPDNIIPLTPEDHFFAHLCLAKGYKSRKLWSAVWVMVHDKKHDGKKKSWAILRKRYGFLQRRRLVGLNHPMADLVCYKFYHIDGYTFEGTRIELGEKYNIPPASVNSLFRGQTQAYGWSLEFLTKEQIVENTQKRAKTNGKKLKGYIRDKKIYHLFNVITQESFIGRQNEISKIIGKSAASSICIESIICTRSGWCLEKNKGFANEFSRRTGSKNNRFNGNLYNFVHVSGKTENNKTISEMGKKYSNGDSRGFGVLASMKRNGYKGWYLEGRKKPIVIRHIYKVINKYGDTFSGTLKEISEKINAHYQTVSRLSIGKIESVKGWRILD